MPHALERKKTRCPFNFETQFTVLFLEEVCVPFRVYIAATHEYKRVEITPHLSR